MSGFHLLLLLVCFTVFETVSSSATVLSQSDFVNGTYRIKASGKYVISENIIFGPRPDLDYWNDPADQTYPMSQYFLGFFAAITIEADDVELNLNGYTIRQSDEFYLLQRFFNVIELNDRVFVDNEGVSSLNYQAGDPNHYPGYENVQRSIPGIKTVKNIVIKNGVVGQSSHSGIHGNGASNVLIKNVVVRDFEISGIHLNGCYDVEIKDTTVGPSSIKVPALATFANARFLDRYTNDLIPAGFAREGAAYKDNLLAHLQSEISFADRPGQLFTLQQVFARVQQATQLYAAFILDNTLPTDSEELALLEQARKVFTNAQGTPDGGVIYGILFNKLGLPPIDENFYGPGYETRNIVVKDTIIKELKARPVDVPGLMTHSGHFLQGPGNDVIRIMEMVDDNFRTITDTKYKGDFLSDGMFAFWKLSNLFYKTRIFDSECANFGSNATMPYPTYGPGSVSPCANGVGQDPTMTGRKATILQKRYFGGLTMSQNFYDWGTIPGTPLSTVLGTRLVQEEKRVWQHTIVCNIDTMHHGMQGVIGLKLVQAQDVTVKDVVVKDLENTGDSSHWVCGQQWRMPNNGEYIKAKSNTLATDTGVNVMGIQVINSDSINFKDVDVKNLNSDEGSVFGFKIQGDTNDRTDYANGDPVKFDSCVVDQLQSGGSASGHGEHAISFTGTQTALPGGLSVGVPEELSNAFKNPKTIIFYGMKNVVAPDLLAFADYGFNVTADIENYGAKSGDEALAYRKRFLDYVGTYFGVEMEDYDSIPLGGPIGVLNADASAGDSIVPGTFSKDYNAQVVCRVGKGCAVTTNSVVNDIFWTYQVGANGVAAHGTFGKEEGKYVSPYESLFAGFYSIENLEEIGIEGNLIIDFYPTCPVGFQTHNEMINSYIGCDLESDIFGTGRAVGNLEYVVRENDVLLNGYNLMMFDDDVDFPVETTANSDSGDTWDLPEILFGVRADGRYAIPHSGNEFFPLLFAHHYTQEAGIRYLRNYTSVNTDLEIFNLRKQFLNRLVNDFGIQFNPDAFDDVPLENIIDLGGGNFIEAYEVNLASNFRTLFKLDARTSNPTATESIEGSRIKEGGFRFVAGRKGVPSIFGNLNFGTLIAEGIYVLENEQGIDLNTEMSFYSKVPLVSDAWASGSLNNVVVSAEYGTGRMMLGVPAPTPHPKGGLLLQMAGSLIFPYDA